MADLSKLKGIFVAFTVCMSFAVESKSACPPDAPPQCAVAQSALARAEAVIREAASKEALWTTASEALREAQMAFDRSDYDVALREAARADEQARLGIAQTRYPPFPTLKP